MEYIILGSLIFLASMGGGACNWIRGTPIKPHNKFIESCFFGLIIAFANGYCEWMYALPIALAMWAGRTVGLGGHVGADLGDSEMQPHLIERWQRGILKTNIELSNTIRGCIWAAPFVILSITPWFSLWNVVIALIISFPLSLALAEHLPLKVFDNTWEYYEFIFGFLVTLISTVMIL